jgi:K+-sensing histidine kinase KdpD
MFSKEGSHQALGGAANKNEAERSTPGMGPVRGWPDLRTFWHEHFPRGSAQTVAAATVLVALATLVRFGLGFLDDLLLPFTVYYPAVLFATYIGGLRVGVYSAILGGLVAWWAFLPPHFIFFPISYSDQLNMVTYALACALLIWGADSYRKLVHLLRDEENFRKLAVEELAHRLRNKIATIQSIISY